MVAQTTKIKDDSPYELQVHLQKPDESVVFFDFAIIWN
jgi:MarR-like DNA-binding transcriptional regulator SgrR of sgrS sRNA